MPYNKLNNNQSKTLMPRQELVLDINEFTSFINQCIVTKEPTPDFLNSWLQKKGHEEVRWPCPQEIAFLLTSSVKIFENMVSHKETHK